MSTSVHPSAVVHPGAEIGQDVAIGPFVVVEDRVRIGDRCRIEPFAHIKSFTSMGAGNQVKSYACIGGDPQHLGYKGEDTRLEIGDNNIFRECVTVHRGTVQGHGLTTIGSDCLLMAYAHVAHDCVIGNRVVLANSVNLAGHVVVGNFVIISGMAAVQQHTSIGDYAFLGGMSGFTLDVPPYMLAHGVRGKLFGPNLIGLKRHGFTSAACQALKKSYRVIFRSGLGKEESLARVLEEFPDIPEVAVLVNFIRESRNGVTPGSSAKNGNGD